MLIVQLQPVRRQKEWQFSWLKLRCGFLLSGPRLLLQSPPPPASGGAAVTQDNDDLNGRCQAAYSGTGGETRQDRGAAATAEDEGSPLLRKHDLTRRGPNEAA